MKGFIFYDEERQKYLDCDINSIPLQFQLLFSDNDDLCNDYKLWDNKKLRVLIR